MSLKIDKMTTPSQKGGSYPRSSEQYLFERKQLMDHYNSKNLISKYGAKFKFK